MIFEYGSMYIIPNKFSKQMFRRHVGKYRSADNTGLSEKAAFPVPNKVEQELFAFRIADPVLPAAAFAASHAGG